jgi:hypothetical protein
VLPTYYVEDSHQKAMLGDVAGAYRQPVKVTGHQKASIAPRIKQFHRYGVVEWDDPCRRAESSKSQTPRDADSQLFFCWWSVLVLVAEHILI